MSQVSAGDIKKMESVAHLQYGQGRYREALQLCEQVYTLDAFRPENLLLLGAIHFQLRNFSEAIFYNQQCVRVEPTFAEAYSNLGNALKVMAPTPR
jgi:protein O-GlcNAc transferase